MKLSEMEQTPEGRIATVIDAFNAEFRGRYSASEFRPSRPNAEDYRVAIRLYIERELLEREIRTTMKYGTHPAVVELFGKLLDLNYEIAKRNTK